jgi:Bacterial Ig-like domain
LDASGVSTALFAVDTVVPTVAVAIDNTFINRAHATGTVTFTFSEAPTAFTLADTTAVGGRLSNLTGSGKSYTATFTRTMSSRLRGAKTPPQCRAATTVPASILDTKKIAHPRRRRMSGTQRSELMMRLKMSLNAADELLIAFYKRAGLRKPARFILHAPQDGPFLPSPVLSSRAYFWRA